AKGQVKIMDFGLAKVEAASILTKEGTTMGTAVYMSPEQAQGKAVDHRSDIWSLGVVLYEMITGQRPFKGDYEQAIIYALVNQDPAPLTALRTGVPVALDGVIAKALAKDPALRYQHADEVPADLRAIDVHPSALATLSTTRRAVASAEAPTRRPLIPWIVAAVMARAAVLTLWGPWRAAPQASISHLALLSEPSESFMDGGFAISPDGSRVVFTGRSGATGAISQLFLRSFDEPQATPLPGTELAESPFFSPDGQWIGFISGARMHVVSVSGGRPIPIYEGLAADASWGPGNQIIFTDSGLSGEGSGELMLVSALGGPPKPLPASEDDAHQYPHRACCHRHRRNVHKG
ncbi:MAG: serine/threonine-protein kinase, partial [Bacteroidetes bacterium]|nr:serine/threonine-protein kinase [Bacteroidota bacterium]